MKFVTSARGSARAASLPAAEALNSLTHGFGAVLSAGALVVMVVQAALRGGPLHVIGAAVFGASLLILYTASTLYHVTPGGGLKDLLRVIDHIGVFVLIAGSYTPFALTVLRGSWGWTILGLVWGLALAGAVLALLFTHRFWPASVVLYLAMGWVGVLAARPMMQVMPLGGILWIVGGGVFYTGGVAFLLLDERYPGLHVIWHLFVLAGSACHVAAVLLYVIP